MAVQPTESISVRYIEQAEPSETFADSLHGIAWDGQTLRLEFCVTRYPDAAAAAGAGAELKRYPVCRLVLTPPAVAALYNRLQQTVTALAKAGAIGTTPPPGAGTA